MGGWIDIFSIDSDWKKKRKRSNKITFCYYMKKVDKEKMLLFLDRPESHSII